MRTRRSAGMGKSNVVPVGEGTLCVHVRRSIGYRGQVPTNLGVL